MESLIKTMKIHGQDIGMEFGRENCAVLIMKRGKREITK